MTRSLFRKPSRRRSIAARTSPKRALRRARASTRRAAGDGSRTRSGRPTTASMTAPAWACGGYWHGCFDEIALRAILVECPALGSAIHRCLKERFCSALEVAGKEALAFPAYFGRRWTASPRRVLPWNHRSQPEALPNGLQRARLS